ncbi:MAG: hypothetical protein ACRYFZ_21335 [Janthinobacterium lividum]
MKPLVICKFLTGVLCILINVRCISKNPPHVNLHGDEALFQRFSKALQPPPGKENCGTYQVDLGEIAPFAWDSIYALTTDAGYIDSITYQLGSIVWRGPAFGHSYRRLVFVRQRKVISYIDYSMFGDLYRGENSMNAILDGRCHGNYAVLARSSALLLTSHIVDSAGHTYYPLVPADCSSAEARKNLLPDCPH